MSQNRIVRAAVAAVAVVAVTGGVASAEPLTSWADSRIAVHFDLSKGQTPENVSVALDGTAYVTFAAARQVATVDRRGHVQVLATLPPPADGGAGTPALHFAATSGIVRTLDGTVYFLYASGDAGSTGLYRLRPGGDPQRIAALPADGLPNGLALDQRTGTFYITDSVLGTIRTAPLHGGVTTVWSAAPELAAAGFLGVNGVKVRDGSLWVSNLDQGTLLRIPLRGARTVQVVASGLAGVDDFDFAGTDVIAAINGANQVVRVTADGRSSTVLTAADGLQNPTSVAVRGNTVLVLSAAYVTAQDPNLIVATLG